MLTTTSKIVARDMTAPIEAEAGVFGIFSKDLTGLLRRCQI